MVEAQTRAERSALHPPPTPPLLSVSFPEAVAFITFKFHILPRHLKMFHESVSLLSQGSSL